MRQVYAHNTGGAAVGPGKRLFNVPTTTALRQGRSLTRFRATAARLFLLVGERGLLLLSLALALFLSRPIVSSFARPSFGFSISAARRSQMFRQPERHHRER